MPPNTCILRHLTPGSHPHIAHPKPPHLPVLASKACKTLPVPLNTLTSREKAPLLKLGFFRLVSLTPSTMQSSMERVF